jgi:hypothetical protein
MQLGSERARHWTGILYLVVGILGAPFADLDRAARPVALFQMVLLKMLMRRGLMQIFRPPAGETRPAPDATELGHACKRRENRKKLTDPRTPNPVSN